MCMCGVRGHVVLYIYSMYVRCCTIIMSVVISNNYTLDGLSGKRRGVRVRGRRSSCLGDLSTVL